MKQAHISSLVSLFPLPQYVVVLEDDEKTRLVPIWIGVSEGNAIALEMNGEKFPRPLTHDLMVNVIREMGAVIEQVIITDIKDNSYFAEIVIRLGDNLLRIDARPSDSLALAVRVKCPVFINDEVLNKCPVIDKPISESEVSKFKDDLMNLTPEEFFKKLEQTPGKKKDLQNALGSLPADDDDENYEEDDDDDEDDDLDDDVLGPDDRPSSS